MRARLSAPAPPTCPDLRNGAAEARTEARDGNPDVWYLKYRDQRGQWCKARATTQQVVQRLRDGRVPSEVQACHQPQGTFLPLRTYPEFAHAVAARRLLPRSKRPAPGSGRLPRPALSGVAGHIRPTCLPTAFPWLLLAAGLGLAVVTGVTVVLCRGWLVP